ncbi:MAG: Gfo/Idh/MocA family oxidoreductase, partial [Calditrichaeota bacterium]|nr:Gfo/Idh/MocA family oxidoreductase [Calditrichota bacterium]
MNGGKVKIGVVGVGHLGRLHAMQLKQVPEAELLGIYDADPQRAATVGTEFSIPVFGEFAPLLEQVEALSIVTPTVTHYDFGRAALEAGKHVFIEKPLTATLEQADELIRLGREQQRKIQIGHIERFNPAIMALEPLEINPLFI